MATRSSSNGRTRGPRLVLSSPRARPPDDLYEMIVGLIVHVTEANITYSEGIAILKVAVFMMEQVRDNIGVRERHISEMAHAKLAELLAASGSVH